MFSSARVETSFEIYYVNACTNPKWLSSIQGRQQSACFYEGEVEVRIFTVATGKTRPQLSSSLVLNIARNLPQQYRPGSHSKLRNSASTFDPRIVVGGGGNFESRPRGLMQEWASVKILFVSGDLKVLPAVVKLSNAVSEQAARPEVF